MHLTDLWNPGCRPSLSFELFPARTPAGRDKLPGTIDELGMLAPDFFSVTFGAGGSTREGSRELVRWLKQEKGHEVLAYFAGYGLPPSDVSAVLDAYRDLGVENLLAVRGDEPRDAPDFRPHPDSFPYASDLVAFVRPRYSFCLGVAGYPEKHVQAVSRDSDLEVLKRKLDLGAEFVISNYFYDNRYFFEFRDLCQARGISVPIVAGIMPIYSIKLTESLAATCGATIPDPVRAGLASLPENDKDAVSTYGVELALEQCRGLLKEGVAGLHLYTMDRSASPKAIVTRLRDEGLL
jgi:methylenetetrahydrofolate reductase (NADPH)